MAINSVSSAIQNVSHAKVNPPQIKTQRDNDGDYDKNREEVKKSSTNNVSITATTGNNINTTA